MSFFEKSLKTVHLPPPNENKTKKNCAGKTNTSESQLFFSEKNILSKCHLVQSLLQKIYSINLTFCA